MLENTVSSIKDLRAVKGNADIEEAKTGRSITYDQYTSLLYAAAIAYDTNFKPKKDKHLIYAHEYLGQDDDSDEDGEDYDIDSPAQLRQVYATDHRRSRSSSSSSSHRTKLPYERWKLLDESSRQIWDKLDDKAKAIILGISKSSSTAPSTTPRRANLHEMTVMDVLQAYIHESTVADEPTDDPPDEEYHDAAESPNDTSETDQATLLINAAKSTKPALSPGDIRRVMSTASKRYQGSNKSKLTANVHITYRVSAHSHSSTSHSLVDRGANGGVAGSDVRIISNSLRSVDIQGIDNHQLNNISIGTVGGVVNTHKGPAIIIMHQYALFGKGTTIHSPGQLEWYKNDVNDKSIHVGGLQRITTLDGYMIPLSIKNGLPRMQLRPYTDEEWDELPHIFLTSELDWDPSVLDHEHENEQWFDTVTEVEYDPTVNLFDEFGNYRRRVIVQHAEYFGRQDGDEIEDIIDQCVHHAHSAPFEAFMHSVTFYDAQDHVTFYETQEHETTDSDDTAHGEPPPSSMPRYVKTKDPDYGSLRPFFGWLSADIIAKTFKHTTQYARLPTGTQLKRAFKSANPALNVLRRKEAVACDIVYSDTPAIDDGSTSAVVFVGQDTQVTDVYGIKTDKQFVNTLEDNIRERGAPTKLISDRAQTEISKKVLDILRTLFISAWQSEPHQQQQNPAERRIQTLKNITNRIMDRTGAPAYTWLLCLKYVCYLLNHTFNPLLNAVPLILLTGITVDISALLRFHFWQKVYYMRVDHNFPSTSRESLGRIVGISEHVGPALTWIILTDDTQKLIYRSQVRPYDASAANLRLDLFGGDSDSLTSTPFIKSRFESDGMDKQVTTLDIEADDTTEPLSEPSTNNVPIFNPEDLVGRTFLLDTEEDGQRHRARIIKMIKDHDTELANNPTRIKFVCSVDNEDKAEEIIAYNKILEHITRDEQNDILWKYRRITSHQGPLTTDHPDYKGSSYNIMVEWETGEITAEPLNIIAKDDPVTCAIYAKDHDLLDLPGWKRFKSIAKRQRKLIRMVNQAKLRSYNSAPRYKYGYEVPRDYHHAIAIDQKTGNTKWQDATKLELEQINEYEVFRDLGHKDGAHAPLGYKRIRVHLVFDVKHDGRHKARLVADGHLTDVPIDSVYSGVVSLRGFRLVLFLAELNGLETWATDIGNAYLEAKTSEKVYIEAGPEFGALQGHVLLIERALYGLRSSGARWHDRFSDCLRELHFQPCKAEPDIWMRRKGDIYEYIAVYVDDLAIAMVDPKEFTDTLINKYKFKLKGTGPISFHLGMEFTRDEDGTMCIVPRKYIEKMVSTYERLYGELPRQSYSSPLEKGDHPELDTSDLLDDKGIKQYQSLIGALQWVVTIGRLDVMTAVMTMSSFRAAPRVGHLDRVKRIYGYLSKMRHACIRIRTDEPDYSDLPIPEYDWSKSVYGELTEDIPKDAPTPLGNYVTLTHYVDANLMHDLATGRSVTGILHLVNKTPADWFSRKQATVETATYGSEFIAARICIEQIIELRMTLRYLGVPIRERSYMFGDNKSVVDSSSQIYAKLHKRHNMLSFHRVREAVASGMVTFQFIPGDVNPADILSKHWGYSQVWPLLKSVLFWKGDTASLQEAESSSIERGVTKFHKE